MGEMLFGLIMTLTFTLAAGIVIQEEGRAGAREMLIGILGCNLAWGIIDGVLYVLGQVFERGRVRRIGLNLRQAASDEEARQMVADEFDDMLVPVTDEPMRQRLYESIVEQRARARLPRRIGCAARTCWAAWPRAGSCLPAVSRRCCRSCSSTTRDWRCACPTRSCSACCSSSVGARRVTRWPSRGSRGVTFLLVGVLLVALAIPLGG